MVETKEKLNVPQPTPVKDFQSSTLRLSPLVYWAQTAKQITLKVDLKDAQSPLVDFTPKSLSFSAKGYGARGMNEYKFDLSFYGFINDEDCAYRLTPNKIEFTIKKVEDEWWPRLVATPQKPHWLKVDFDRWRTEDDMLDEKPRDVMQDYAKEFVELQKQEIGYIKESTKKVYLIMYNLAQFIGYLYILSVLSILYYRDGPHAFSKAYESVGTAMKFCQLFQTLEILHPMFNYTKGSVLIPFLQVTGRSFVLFVMIEMEVRMQTKPAVFYVFVIWSLIEVFRYPYYLSHLFGRELPLLTWLRYTLWIPLYPLGILCEGIIILRNIPYFEETKLLTMSMPNKWNIAFDMPTFLKIYLIILILPGSYLLMTHMAKARAKKLGRKKRQRHHHATHID